MYILQVFVLDITSSEFRLVVYVETILQELDTKLSTHFLLVNLSFVNSFVDRKWPNTTDSVTRFLKGTSLNQLRVL